MEIDDGNAAMTFHFGTKSNCTGIFDQNIQFLHIYTILTSYINNKAPHPCHMPTKYKYYKRLKQILCLINNAKILGLG